MTTEEWDEIYPIDKIPTAKEFFNEQLAGEPLTQESVIEGLIEFAKFHVRAQREAIKEKAKVIMIENCSDHTPFRGACCSCGRYDNPEIPSDEIDKKSIDDAYLLTKIK